MRIFCTELLLKVGELVTQQNWSLGPQRFPSKLKNSSRSFHPSIICCLFLSRVVGSSLSRKTQEGHVFAKPPIPALQGGLQGHPRDIVSPTCPGSFHACPSSWTWLESLPKEACRRHPYQMPELKLNLACKSFVHFLLTFFFLYFPPHRNGRQHRLLM